MLKRLIDWLTRKTESQPIAISNMVETPMVETAEKVLYIRNSLNGLMVRYTDEIWTTHIACIETTINAEYIRDALKRGYFVDNRMMTVEVSGIENVTTVGCLIYRLVDLAYLNRADMPLPNRVRLNENVRIELY